MITASDALNSIEQAANSIRADEDRLAATMKSASEEAARLRTEESAEYRALAKIRLDALQHQQIVGALGDAEQRALVSLDLLGKRLDEIEVETKKLAGELAAAQAERLDKAKAVAAAKDAVNIRVAETHKRLADAVDWQAAVASATGAQSRAMAANEKAIQSEKDRDEKSKPYLADKLFVYLWQRGYGTAIYHGDAFARMGDGFVARVISYEEARQNYFMLTEIPKRLREHADRLQEEAEAEKQKLAAFERKELEADGIAGLEKAEDVAAKALQAANDKVKSIEAARAVLDSERSGLLDGGDRRGLRSIIDDLAEALQREDVRTLLLRARQTPSQEDDQIVDRIQKIDASLETLQKQIDAARDAAIALARKRAELERAQDNFMRAGYDRRGGTFVNEQLIGSIISGIIQGAMVSRQLDDALRSGYRDRPRPNIEWGGGGGGSWGGGGGSWGGSGGGGGGSGGGGFRTGGGF